MIEKLREMNLYLAGTIYALPLWILLYLGFVIESLRWLAVLSMPGIVIVSFLGVLLTLTIGADSIEENMVLWHIPVASCVFYYFLILLILLILRGRRAKPANQQSDPS